MRFKPSLDCTASTRMSRVRSHASYLLHQNGQPKTPLEIDKNAPLKQTGQGCLFRQRRSRIFELEVAKQIWVSHESALNSEITFQKSEGSFCIKDCIGSKRVFLL